MTLVKKESVEWLDMLLYLCREHQQSALESLDLNYDDILNHMEGQGFERSQVLDAIDWLDSLMGDLSRLSLSGDGFRVYTKEESFHLGTSVCNCLIQLENAGILSPNARERVIQQLLELNCEIDAGLVKWVCFLVVCTQPERADALAKMELFLTEQFLGGVH